MVAHHLSYTQVLPRAHCIPLSLCTGFTTAPSSTSVPKTGNNSTTLAQTYSKQSAFEQWLHHNINTPILNFIPHSVNPNAISFFNTFVCWLALLCAYQAYKYGEDIHTRCALREYAIHLPSHLTASLCARLCLPLCQNMLIPPSPSGHVWSCVYWSVQCSTYTHTAISITMHIHTHSPLLCVSLLPDLQWYRTRLSRRHAGS